VLECPDRNEWTMSDAGFADDDDEAQAALRERFSAATSGAEDAGRQCGLYLEDATPAATSDGSLVVMATFAVGDLAFTDRVLYPAKEDDAKEIREREVDAALDERNRIVREAREGKGPLAALEDDDEGK